MNSNIFSIDWADFGKGLLVAVITAVLTFFIALLKEKGFDISAADVSMIVQVAITSMIAYLAKNFLSNSEGKFGRVEK